MKFIKKYLLCLAAGLSLLIAFGLSLIAGSLAHGEDTQTMAERWSKKNDYAQISCFFSINGALNRDRIEEFEHSLDDKLEQASITVDNYGLKEGETRNENARLWADAYSAGGRVSVTSNKTTINVQALGVGGDFFLFHPLELLSGAYFAGNGLMSDYVILDEDAAWQLFGSNDVAGQIVTIGSHPHIVTGVVKRQEGRLYKSAGLSESLIYVSYDTLLNYGSINYGSSDSAVNHFEIVMPNPVSGFALGVVRESFGGDEKNVEILENTSRFSLLSLFKIIVSFGTRSMNGKAIIYPYWENAARGYEDIAALITLLCLIFFLFPAIVVIVLFVRLWKNKGWTVKEKILWLKDKFERYLEKRRERKKKEENFEF